MNSIKKLALPIFLLFGVIASSVSNNNYFIVLGFVLGLFTQIGLNLNKK